MEKGSDIPGQFRDKGLEWSKIFTVFGISFFLFCFFFDFSVSFTAFKVNPVFFGMMESNKYLVDVFRNGELPGLWLYHSIGIVIGSIVIYYLERHFKREWLSFMVCLAFTIMVCIGSIHLIGGLSWWML